MRIEWLPLARDDQDTQLDFVAAQDPWAAIRLGDALEQTIETLSDHPLVGRTGRVKGTRELVVPKSPFVVVYQVERDSIVILRLLHGAQRWPQRS